MHIEYEHEYEFENVYDVFCTNVSVGDELTTFGELYVRFNRKKVKMILTEEIDPEVSKSLKALTKDLNWDTLTWEQLEGSEAGEVVVEYLQQDSHFTEVASSLLEKIHKNHAIVAEPETMRETFEMFACKMKCSNKEELFSIIKDHWEEFPFSMEELQEYLVEELL